MNTVTCPMCEVDMIEGAEHIPSRWGCELTATKEVQASCDHPKDNWEEVGDNGYHDCNLCGADVTENVAWYYEMMTERMAAGE